MQISNQALKDITVLATQLLLSEDPEARKGGTHILQRLTDEGVPLAAINMGFFLWACYEKSHDDEHKDLSFKSFMKAPKQDVLTWLEGVDHDTEKLIELLRKEAW